MTSSMTSSDLPLTVFSAYGWPTILKFGQIVLSNMCNNPIIFGVDDAIVDIIRCIFHNFSAYGWPTILKFGQNILSQISNNSVTFDVE